MSMLKLIRFECKKQIKSVLFLIVLVILTVFAITQLNEIFYMPVSRDRDIQALEKSGERDFIFVKNTDMELKEQTIQYLKQAISEGAILAENTKEFTDVLEMLLDDRYTFDDIFTAMKDNERVFSWLIASKTQFGVRLGSVDEVNRNFHEGLGDNGYSPYLFIKYVTYMQAVAAFLIFPLFLLMLTRDYRYDMYEVLYVQPLSPTMYILSRFFGVFLPFVVYLYLFGLVLNLISVFRFVKAGYAVSYFPFITYFIIYLLPAIFFLSCCIMLLMLLINKAVAVFPIYIVYIAFNMTPGVFGYDNRWIKIINLINPMIRLDIQMPQIGAVLINRIVYLILGFIFLFLSCKMYEKLRKNLRKVITI